MNQSINPGFIAKKSVQKTVSEYIDGIRSGDKTILSQAITLVESSKSEHQILAREILDKCLKYTGKSLRLGISGVPGVGKSTFIDALGRKRIEQGDRVAVLTIDPSSRRSGGSILGDKTRMENLAVHSNAYIRPSPASGTLGGVARKTREAMMLCEAAGYDAVFIETVGVGQSETTVHSMVDIFLVLLLPGAGDELQGIKRGIIEMADLIAVNKADGGSVEAAQQARQQYEKALSLYAERVPGWKTPVVSCSALNGSGLDDLWSEIDRFITHSKTIGRFEDHRNLQAIDWMHENIEQLLKESFYGNKKLNSQMQIYEKKVKEGRISSFKAATELIKLFKGMY